MIPDANPRTKDMTDYEKFIEGKSQLGGRHGFKPIWMPDWLFNFQGSLVEWNLLKGRSATLADCGLGKTPMQLVWCENIVRKTNKNTLIVAPLSVAGQTVREAAKFGVECARSSDGKVAAKITVTNYERLHYFNRNDFEAVACDESSILKNFDGLIKEDVTEFMRLVRYRSLWTATAAPNDHPEFGTSAEALGVMGYMDMLNRFFKNDVGTNHPNHGFFSGKWRFRGHAEHDFWRWVCSWARAIRKPSDLGFDDGAFILPELKVRQHVIQARTRANGMLIDLPAMNLHEQREERRRTITERCEAAAVLVNGEATVCWCNLNPEGDLLEKIIPGAAQVAGADADERKEELFAAFQSGELKTLITKPKIGGFGLNWQHCAHQTFFPSHSFEQWYQCIRRSWRFGQKNPVLIDVITSEGEARVLQNLQRKAKAAELAFETLVELMNSELKIEKKNEFTKKQEIPSWL